MSTDSTSRTRVRGGGLPGALAFEWIKMAGVRSTWWSVAGGFFLIVCVDVVIGLSTAVSGDNGYDVTRPAPHAAMEGLLLAQLPFIALAALAVTSEYATGTIRTSLQSVPVRGRLMFAKAVVVTVLIFVSGVALCLVGTAVLAPLSGGYTDFTPGELAGTATATGTYLALLGLLTLGLGTFLRSAAGTIVATTLLLLAVPQLLRLATVDWLADVSDFLPDTAGSILLTQGTDPYGSGVALVVLVGWAAVASGAGFWRLRTRDA
ncbi:ABC transporter [Cryptosporangium sp. NPDC048952]|uniref:ABC transporter n=1 Tax=Cryptosporangium sp. NPDC048952 TaxID=3363961 RepID=UPI003717CE4D